MSQQIRFFEKSLIDLSKGSTTVTVTDATATNTGQNLANLMFNRNNSSGWITTGSNDAANTQVDFTFNGVLQFDTIIMIKHNLKAYTIQYYDEDTLSYTNFSTAISETNVSTATNYYQFTAVNSSRLRLIITGTQTADIDKFIAQFIVTRKIRDGQLVGWPIITKTEIDLQKNSLKTISGKSRISRRVGAFSCQLDFKTWPSQEDMDLIEDLHFLYPNGFLMWPCGGDETQFKYTRQAFRLEDIYLCGVASEWRPEWYKGLYKSGLNLKVLMEEVI